MATVTRLIALSALERTESRGSLVRRDFSESDFRWLVNVLTQAKNGGVSVWTEPVRLTRARPEAHRPEALTVEVGD